jgi:hypothetical protein
LGGAIGIAKVFSDEGRLHEAAATGTRALGILDKAFEYPPGVAAD